MLNISKVKIVFVVTLCILFVSCKKQSQVRDADVIHINTEGASVKMPKDIIKEWNIIELENAPEAFISEIRDMAIVDNKIYCFSRDLGGYVVVFNTTGKFLFKIHHVGKARNEWIELSSFFVNTKEKFILLTDRRSKKVLKYDMEGNYMRTYDIGKNGEMEVAMNHNLLYSVTSLLATGGHIVRSNDYKIHVYNESGDLEGKEVETWYNDLNVVQTRNWNEITMSYEGKMFYTSVLSEYVYEIQDKNIVPFLKYNYVGKHKLISEDEMQRIRDNGDLIWGTDGMTFYTNEFIDSPDYIYRRMGYAEAFDILYDKKSKHVCITQFDAPYLGESGISEQILYPAPLIYEDGLYYAPFLTTVFELPDSFIQNGMPEVLQPYMVKHREGNLNALIFTYKIVL